MRISNTYLTYLISPSIACYFNSLIQSLFQIKDFVVLVLNYKVLADIDKVLAEKDINDPAIINRKKVKCIGWGLLLGSKKLLGGEPIYVEKLYNLDLLLDNIIKDIT